MNYARPIPDIIADLLRQFTTLVSTERELARTEVSEKLTQVGAGLGLIVGGSVLVIPGLVVLLQAGVAALVEAGIAAHWASLIVGGAVVVIGLILVAVGVIQMRPKQLVPTRTIEQIQQDVRIAKQQVSTDHDQVQRPA